MDHHQIKCPKCQAQVPENAQFCVRCGTPIPKPEPISTEDKSIPESQDTGKSIPHLCPRCQHSTKPGDTHCEACGYPLSAEVIGDLPTEPETVQPGLEDAPRDPVAETPAARQPAEKKVPKPAKPPRKKPSLIKIAGVVALVVVIGVGGFFAWKWWQGGGTTSIYAEIEPCDPQKPGEDFELSNKNDLNGEIRKDIYFASGEEYQVAENSSLVIPEGITLLIEPGARVRFGEGSRLVVKGTLLACGKNNRRILFTADTSAGRPGFWYGLEFDGADDDSVLGHVTIEFAGREQHAPIWLKNIDLHVEDAKFDSNAWYSISFDPDSFPGIRLPFLVENGLQGWEARSGVMTKDRVWIADQDIVASGLLEISNNTSLTISPGTWVKYLPGGRLIILGDLNARATQDQPIIMTSVNDSAEEGTPAPMAGDWGGLQFIGEDSNAELDYVEVRYAGNPNIQPGCIYLEQSAPVLRNVTISECNSFALSSDLMADPTIEGLNLPDVDHAGAWELRSSTLEANHKRTLSNLVLADDDLQIPAVVTGWLRVLDQADLSIEPGTELLFKNGRNSGLLSEGELVISGTEELPVIFTSWRDISVGGTQGADPGDWGGLVLKNSKVDTTRIEYLKISYGGAEDMNCLILSNASPMIENLEIENCRRAPINSDAASTPVIDNLTLENNQLANIYEIRGSELEERREYVWQSFKGKDGANIVRRITGKIQIKRDAGLRLEPGIVVQFSENGSLYVQGDFQAVGSPEEQILFTSWKEFDGNSQPGDWSGIIFEGKQASHVIQHAQINYAGAFNGRIACITLIDSAVNLDHVQISNCDYYPISSDLASSPTVTGLDLEGNYPANEWEIRQSNLPQGLEVEWEVISGDQDQIIRTATGWLGIEQEAELSIRAGVILKFQENTGLYSEGTLSVEGTPDEQVVFTSWRDPLYSTESGVQAGDWVGLVLKNAKRDTILQDVVVNYAGRQNNPRGGLALIESSPTISGVSIMNSAWYPISLDMNSSPTMEFVILEQNQPVDGVELRSSHLSVPGEKVFDYWETLQGHQVIRVVTGAIYVDEAASLRISPNVIVKFNNDGKLISNGGLVIQDAILTSVYDEDFFAQGQYLTGQRSWYGIEINGKTFNQMEDSMIRYANIALDLKNAAPQITDVQIDFSGLAAIRSDFSTDLSQLNRVGLNQNAINGVLIEEGVLPDGKVIWGVLNGDGPQLIRVLNTAIRVGADTELLIEPGVIIKFLPGGGLVADGKLLTDLGAELPVVLTSFADDSVGGDTDSLADMPRRGSWLGLEINPGDTSAQAILHRVTIKFAIVGLRITNLAGWEYSSLVIENSQQLGLSCDASFEYFPDDPELSLIDNGILTEACPTPDR